MKRAALSLYAVLICAVLGSALSCTSSPAPAPAPPAPSAAPPASAPKPRPAVDLSLLERRIHDRINKERTRRGLPTMRWDDALGRIADKHSRDMAGKRYFGHISPQGHDYSYRYMKEGYACGVTVNGVLRRGAESIFRLSPEAGEDLAGAAIRGWLENGEDRKNLLSSPWERDGVGICIGPDGLLYITLNFC